MPARRRAGASDAEVTPSQAAPASNAARATIAAP